MNYLSKNDPRYGHANAKTGEISIQKGMKPKLKKAVIKHEKEHLKRGESGDLSFKSVLGAAAPIIGGAFGGPLGASIGSTVGGLLAGSGAAGSQSRASTAGSQQSIASQQAARREADAAQQRQLQQTRSDTATQRRVGDESLNFLSSGLRAGGEFAPQQFEMGDFTADPGYDFRLQQGAQARGNALSSGGMRLSGRAQKELERYGQDYGSNEYGNVYNRRFGEFKQNQNDRQNYLARHMQLAGYGSQGIGTAANAGINAANQMGINAMSTGANVGNTQYQQGINQANIKGQKYGNIANTITGGIQNYLALNQQQKQADLFNNNNNNNGSIGQSVFGTLPQNQRVL